MARHAGSIDVRAMLNYTLRNTDGEPLWTSVIKPPLPAPSTNVIIDPREVVIHDARGKENHFTLDKNGFQFLTYPSAVPDLLDERSIKQAYYAEVTEMLKQCTGSQNVVIAGHMHRRSHPGKERITNFTDPTGPAFTVHGDRGINTEKYLLERGLDVRSRGRFRIINVWRPVGETVHDVPLAMLDQDSVNVDRDLVSVEVKYAAQTLETLAAYHSPEHAWYYLRHQTPQEVVLMKNYDSMIDGTARFSMHSAFCDLTCDPESPSRVSVEVRGYVFD